MKIKHYPKELVINDYVWEIRFVRKMPQGYDHCLGLCDEGEKRIYIKLGQKPAERLATLYHEILHAICFEHEIKLKHTDIYKLEGPLADLMRINFYEPMGM